MNERNGKFRVSRTLSPALEAGLEYGGDAVGERSSNLILFNTEEYPLFDIRVDDWVQLLKQGDDR